MAADRSTDGGGPLDFHGRVVVVTGGGRGIGRAVTEAFLGAGAEVVVCGRTEVSGDGLPTGVDAGRDRADRRLRGRRRAGSRPGGVRRAAPPSTGTAGWTCS